ncbi:DUF1656 domain-containing protein [Acinetobacter soli]|jgi:hypothetical protein|uniref:DUF1656 domain-containing protein n=1 Tax=Acinetobacter soli TaxID=487316 RepID=UPI001ABC0B30|nr:DUF1656 domain-containing protein [Acinetobacter soli]MBO3640868.1 DUF1656 domain-containing protein [Acinetobacter soli]WEH88231.1 DUF1656 domain-containing protein [Acinetobacter soli]WEI09866.1 DUF1656 domain-containing protein [Acinetobacter soli]
MGEFNAYGVYFPSFLIQAICAFIVFKIVTRGTDRLIAAGWIGFPGVFNLCLYIILLMGMHWIFIWQFGR